MQSRPVLLAVIVVLSVSAIGGTVYVARRVLTEVEGEKAAAKPPPVQSRPAPPVAQDKAAPARPAQPPRSTAAAKPQPEWRQRLDEGLAAYRDKRPDDAIAHYANAIGIAERSGKRAVLGVVLSYTGSLYWSMRKLDLAEIHLLRAVEITEKLTEAEIVAELGSLESLLAERTQRMLALVYRDQGRDAEAIRHFGKAIEATRDLKATRPDTVGFSNAGNFYDIAVLQCKTGNREAARKALAEARRLNPQSPSTDHRQKAYARLEETLDNPKACRG